MKAAFVRLNGGEELDVGIDISPGADSLQGKDPGATFRQNSYRAALVSYWGEISDAQQTPFRDGE